MQSQAIMDYGDFVCGNSYNFFASAFNDGFEGPLAEFSANPVKVVCRKDFGKNLASAAAAAAAAHGPSEAPPV